MTDKPAATADLSLFDKFRSITDDGLNKLKEPFAKRKIFLKFNNADSNSEIVESEKQESFDDMVKGMVKNPATFDIAKLLEIKRDITAEQKLIKEMNDLRKEILGK